MRQRLRIAVLMLVHFLAKQRRHVAASRPRPNSAHAATSHPLRLRRQQHKAGIMRGQVMDAPRAASGAGRGLGPDVPHGALPGQAQRRQRHLDGDRGATRVEYKHRHGPIGLRLCPYLPSNSSGSDDPTHIMLLEDGRGKRRALGNEPAWVAVPLLVHSDGLRVGDDGPYSR